MTAADPYMQVLSSSVGAFIQPPGGWFVNNAGVVLGRDAGVVIDTCATEARNQRLLEDVRAFGLRTDMPVTVALTHGHGDHTHGAALFESHGATILARPEAIGEIAAGPHTFDMLFECGNWGNVSPPKNMTAITERSELDLGDTLVEVVPVPYPAHTFGDVVVWHADSETLFTGDLLFNQVTPLGFAGSWRGWLSALDWLAGFGAATYVPGHGPVCSSEAGTAIQLREYIEWLFEATENPDEPEYADLERFARSRWANWAAGERHVANIRTAHAQQHGVNLDFASGVKDLLASAAAAGETMSPAGTLLIDL